MDWAASYNAGRTIQSIADEEGCSYCKIRGALKKVGVKFRSRGERPRQTPEQRRERLRKKGLRQYHAKTPEQKRDRNWKNWLKVMYNLTVEQYDTMLVAQCGRCDICELPLEGKVDVDHNHETGAVRSLLCHGCNIALAHVEDEAFRAAALAYLEKHRE